MLKVLEVAEDVCYLLDQSHRFIYCNPAWDRFAAANGAARLTGESVVGTNVFDAIPKVLTGVYTHAFTSASTGSRVWSKVYQCSSPEVLRKFRMRIHPIKRVGWFLVSNSLVVERQHRKPAIPMNEMYFSRGIVVMCAHCRCTQRAADPTRWDFVREYLRLKGPDTLNVSQGLCSICTAYFYPDL
jgi:hypothetical protein